MARTAFRPLLALALCAPAALAAQPVPANLYNQLHWRLIGPFRGGRVVAVAGVPGDPATFYFGAVGGGVWKTTSAGTVWSPIFDQQPISSIGAVAVAPSNPNTVYVGTGEADIRSQIGFGDGVYKSTDAGKSWTNSGLRETRQIAKILVDPANPDVVYVAALGHVYGPNPERGVFRSTDGGRDWQKVLFTDPTVGAADLAFDPANAKIIYATLWNGSRPPWSQYAAIEGPGSGLWKTTDGGDHWTQLTGHGLPEAQWRRAGISVGAGSRVYAIIDAQQGGGVFRSDDGGDNWTRVSSDSRLTNRGWYFSGITADPANPDVVYVPNVALYRSTDGGKSFTVLKGAPGGDDYHILWIDPKEPRRMVLGSDQGTNVSVDRGATWTTWNNQPTAQMYHVTTDNRFPYAVIGSQQDSGTAAVLSRTDHGEIDARDWFSVGGAESGYIAVDTKDDNILYVSDTNGTLVRYDRRTSQAQDITPWPGPAGSNISTGKYRFPWTAPLVFSSTEPDTLYYGAQYLLKTTDGGRNWSEISPDLTGDTRKDTTVAADPVTSENARAQGYGVIYAIGPSPVKAGLVWVGSDTGLIHLTRDGGKTWENVTPAGLPDWSRVTQLEASHFDPAVAFATVDRHRMEDYNPYVYRTRDYGKTWTQVTGGLQAPAYLNGIREDPMRQGLLYLATEMGVEVSFDDGDRWQSLQLNLPAVSVRDLVVHGDDLVIATFGRGFWILDNASPLRQIEEPVVTADGYLFQPAAAVRMNPQSFSGTPFPVEEPKAKNPPNGAMIDYYLKAAPEKPVVLEILDAKDEVVRRYTSADPAPPMGRAGAIADVWFPEPPHLTANAGTNRFVWDLRYSPPGVEMAPDDGDFGGLVPGPQVLPGEYRVRLTAGGQTYMQPLTVKLDPRSTATPEDLTKQLQLSLFCSRGLSQAAAALNEVAALRRQIADRRQSASPELDAKLAALDAEAAQMVNGEPGPSLNSVSARLSTALTVAESADRTPPETAYVIFGTETRELSALLGGWQELQAKAVRLLP